VRFRRGARLDPGQVSDRRGMGPGLGGLNPRMFIGGGGGIVGLVILAIFALTGGLSGGGSGGGSGLGLEGGDDELATSCETGADANQSRECRIVGVVNSVQDFWSQAIDGYQEAQTVFFDGQVSTGCGLASSAVGPFYCPSDSQVYIDLGFYDELETQFGARGGPFAEAYVIAHEYGHHVQHLLGTNEQGGSDREGPKSGSVRLELQADCYAGVWAAHALDTGFIAELNDNDIADGLDAAASVGDDRIQEKVQGRVDPESFTHGTARQRQKWFSIGYRKGDAEQCDTFAEDAL